MFQVCSTVFKQFLKAGLGMYIGRQLKGISNKGAFYGTIFENIYKRLACKLFKLA